MQFHPYPKKGKKQYFLRKMLLFQLHQNIVFSIHMRFLRLMRQVTRLLFFFRNLAVIVDT